MWNGLSSWLSKTFFRHRHHAKPVRVQHVKLPYPAGPFGGSTGQVVDSTVVLYTCTECGSAETTTLLGTWSLEEVQGKVGAPSDAVDSLLRSTGGAGAAGGAR